MDIEILEICTAYEQGYGKGYDMRKCVNPYKLLSKGWKAWDYGYSEGSEKSINDSIASNPLEDNFYD